MQVIFDVTRLSLTPAFLSRAAGTRKHPVFTSTSGMQLISPRYVNVTQADAIDGQQPVRGGCIRWLKYCRKQAGLNSHLISILEGFPTLN